MRSGVQLDAESTIIKMSVCVPHNLGKFQHFLRRFLSQKDINKRSLLFENEKNRSSSSEDMVELVQLSTSSNAFLIGTRPIQIVDRCVIHQMKGIFYTNKTL